MYIKIGWDEDFNTLMMHLWAKYGRRVFTENGIGDQLDLNKFSKDFFNNNTTTADVSVDDNSNISGRSVIDYNFEFQKPLQKYNSHYLLWKQLRTSYGLLEANQIIEKQISGEIYINDFSDVARPYSYHPQTSILTDENGEITMEELFNKYSHLVDIKDDMEEINLFSQGIKVFDGKNFVPMSRVLRHRSHTDLLNIETKSGSILSVTEDHPFITEDYEDGLEAKNLSKDDIAVLTARKAKNTFIDCDYMTPELAYLVGAMIGDGHTGRQIGFTQKNVAESHFYSKFNKYFDTTVNGGKTLCLSNGPFTKTHWSDMIGVGAKNKHLPTFSNNLDEDSSLALLAGIVDTDGTINKLTGVIDIRVTSFALIQQVAALCERLGFNRIRTSLVGKQHSEKSFKSKLQMYRVSFVCNNEEFCNYCVKANKHKDVVFKNRKIDGRFEGGGIHKIEKMPWKGEWVYDITTETGRFSSNGVYCHNCFNYSTYDVALEGLTMSRRMTVKPPKSLDSFIRQMEQFIVYCANSTLGATGIADVLIVASYYVDRIFDCSDEKCGDDGKINIWYEFNGEKERVWTYVSEKLRSFIYTLNWEFRGNQSPFTNVSIYDDYFLEELVGDYIFADGKSPKIDTIKKVQKLFIEAMNEELERSELTFPIVTACFTVEDGKIKDENFLGYIAEQNMKFGFINMFYGKSSVISGCCRLRSDKENEYFNSFGAGSTKIGSIGVVTQNFPRLAYIALKDNNKDEKFIELLKESVRTVAKINNCKRNIIKKRIELNAMPLYTLGHMDLSKQYSTYGVNGLNEALEILGYDITSENGEDFVIKLLDIINEENDKMAKRFKSPHSCEQTPSESSAVKLAQRDRTLKYQDKYHLYSNQFIPLTTTANMLERIRLQGKFDNKFSGGCVCHINIGEEIKNKQTMVDLMNYAAKCGVVYWSVNYVMKRCKNNHVFIDAEVCPICGCNVDRYITRTVGFCTNVANWNEVRRTLDFPHRQFYKGVGNE